MKKNIPIFLLLSFIFSSCISSSELERIKNDKTILYPIGENGKWGYADSTGETVIPYQYEKVSFFYFGLAAVAENGKYGFIKTDGNFHLKPKYELAENFIGDCAKVEHRGEVRRINWKGRKCKSTRTWSTGCVSPSKTKSSEENSVQKGDKFALLLERYIIPENKDDWEIVLDTSEYLFQDVRDFSFHYLLVKKDDKYGFFPETTHDLLNEKTGACEPFKINNQYNICFKYDEVLLNYEKYGGDGVNYSIQRTPFRIGKYWGVLDGQGKELIPAKYLSLEIYDWRLAKVEYEADKFGYVKIYGGAEYFKRTDAS